MEKKIDRGHPLNKKGHLPLPELINKKFAEKPLSKSRTRHPAFFIYPIPKIT